AAQHDRARRGAVRRRRDRARRPAARQDSGDPAARAAGRGRGAGARGAVRAARAARADRRRGREGADRRGARAMQRQPDPRGRRARLLSAQAGLSDDALRSAATSQAEAGAVTEGRAERAELETIDAPGALPRTISETPSPPGAEPPRLPAGAVLGRYVIEALIGTGGMGVVYRARDPDLGRAVAIKQLGRVRSDWQWRARLLREAQAMARLAHPNVVTVYDVGLAEEGLFVAMEYVEGVTLRRWLAEPRTRQEVVAAFVAAGRGLHAAHLAGLVHRDFK